jgi:hypothetical protein
MTEVKDPRSRTQSVNKVLLYTAALRVTAAVVFRRQSSRSCNSANDTRQQDSRNFSDSDETTHDCLRNRAKRETTLEDNEASARRVPPGAHCYYAAPLAESFR